MITGIIDSVLKMVAPGVLRIFGYLGFKDAQIQKYFPWVKNTQVQNKQNAAEPADDDAAAEESLKKQAAQDKM